MQAKATWQCVLRRFRPMTLIIAIPTPDDRIIIGSDGLIQSYDRNTDSNLGLSTNKLYRVEHTDWVLAFAGDSALAVFHKQIEAELKLGQRRPFDPHIDIGGPAYFNALSEIAFKAMQSAPGTTMNETRALLAGFDINNKPYLLESTIPKGGFHNSPGGWSVIAATGPAIIATWLLLGMQKCYTSIEAIKKLICFMIWQVSRTDMRIGRLDAGYPITLCVMEAGKPPQYESRRWEDLDRYLCDWESHLQACLMRAIDAIEL
jgi:hypothetical protein